MMTIAYYQGALDKYKDHAIITRIIKDSRNCDYIIAPIADHRMFKIRLNSLIGDLVRRLH